MHDVPNLDPGNPCIIIDHPILDCRSQQKFGTEDHGDDLNMAEVVSNPIDIESEITIDVATNVKVELTIDMEHKLILNESVEEPIHFLAIVGKVPSEEVDEFDSLSFEKGNKAR
ncbi:hypothetical protein PVK06_008637 [Gossypium arboreum]|uniref:Uncharacterized protein n=1 Tax=Gossypium arboreum TaxID=29729 RepID=A0ABR0QLN5_GOSAR|nr:hypothetical protein PVK06_008637 [Gossypium arboreum]